MIISNNIIITVNGIYNSSHVIYFCQFLLEEIAILQFPLGVLEEIYISSRRKTILLCIQMPREPRALVKHCGLMLSTSDTGRHALLHMPRFLAFVLQKMFIAKRTVFGFFCRE